MRRKVSIALSYINQLKLLKHQPPFIFKAISRWMAGLRIPGMFLYRFESESIHLDLPQVVSLLMQY